MRETERQGSAERAVKTVALGVSVVIAAYLLAVAVSTTGHAWLGWFTLFPLFCAIRAQRPIGAMLSGALWGLSLYAFLPTGFESTVGPAVGSTGIGWTEIPISVLGLPSSLVLLTIIPAIYAFLASWVTRWIGFSPFVLGVGWMGVELALAPLGLRNALLAGTQGDGRLLHVVGDLLGYVLVGFIVGYVTASLLSVVEGVGVAIPRPRPIAAAGHDGTRLSPQTFTCFAFSWIHSSQPRAPPV